VIAQLVSPLLAAQAEGRVLRRLALLRGRRRRLGADAGSGQRALELHCLGKLVVTVLAGERGVLGGPHLDGGLGRGDGGVVWHVARRRNAHVGAVGGRRRRVLVGHYICHGLWRRNRIRSGGAWAPEVQFRLEGRRGDDCHERVLVLEGSPGLESLEGRWPLMGNGVSTPIAEAT
jgi:hypothetical protein